MSGAHAPRCPRGRQCGRLRPGRLHSSSTPCTPLLRPSVLPLAGGVVRQVQPGRLPRLQLPQPVLRRERNRHRVPQVRPCGHSVLLDGSSGLSRLWGRSLARPACCLGCCHWAHAQGSAARRDVRDQDPGQCVRHRHRQHHVQGQPGAGQEGWGKPQWLLRDCGPVQPPWPPCRGRSLMSRGRCWHARSCRRPPPPFLPPFRCTMRTTGSATRLTSFRPMCLTW